jgi:protein-S-isoprenylcysteine O-methyltransferase Ste14
MCSKGNTYLRSQYFNILLECRLADRVCWLKGHGMVLLQNDILLFNQIHNVNYIVLGLLVLGMAINTHTLQTLPRKKSTPRWLRMIITIIFIILVCCIVWALIDNLTIVIIIVIE